MFLRSETVSQRTLTGLRIRMSFSEDRTSELWRNFRMRLAEFVDPAETELFSVRIYDRGTLFDRVSPDMKFDKWAAIEMRGSAVPEGLEMITLPEGDYAVFSHRGLPSTAPQTFRYIYSQWLPSSGSVVDDKPHFEILPKGWEPTDPNAEETIWLPIKPSSQGENL